MKKENSVVYTAILGLFLLFSFHIAYSQGDVYSDDIDDQGITDRESDYSKKQSPLEADPYYEDQISKEWERKQDEKAKELIEELKKEYKTDTFNKEVLDKKVSDPAEKKSQDVSDSQPSDPYYEDSIKKERERERDETKKEIVDWMRSEIEGKDKEGGSDAGTSMEKSSDPYYDKEIKESWQKDKKDLMERVRKKLKEDKSYTIVEEEKKAKGKKSKTEEDGKEEKKDEGKKEEEGNSFWFFFSDPLARHLS